MKLDLKKQHRGLYEPTANDFSVVKVPDQRIISIEGRGSPSTSTEFKHAVEALFPAAYHLKFLYKKQGKDYAVMPLEGFWWADDMNDFTINNQDQWLWQLFVVQPDFVTKEAFDTAIDQVGQKKRLPALSKIKFETIHEGSAAQILYIGPFAQEGPTIQRLHDFIRKSGHSFNGLKQRHHEIYLSDMRKTAPAKLKTIIRQSFV